MYCPKCGIEYRAGFTECADCHTPLAAERRRENTIPGDPDMDLATVLEGNDPVRLAAAKGLLEEAGIPFSVLGEDPRYAPVGAFMHPWRRIQVGADREPEARLLLQQLEESNQAGDATG